jgi:DNA-binding transcriptional regulator YiaG
MPGDMTGNEARTLRLGLRLSAAKLGVLIGTTESSIYRWEKRGERAVPRMYAHALKNVVREYGRSNGDDRAVPRRQSSSS